jgi:hypothetical protein
MPLTIAILFHERERRLQRKFTIQPLARLWRADGHTIKFVYGADQHEPADVAILHIDLSVVPPEYVSLAAQYPVVLNGNVTDIRKSVISRQLVRPGDDYDGPVIVKTDLNRNGLPEQYLHRLPRVRVRLRRLFGPHPVRHRGRYPVFDSIEDVPGSWLADPALVVERFVPERVGDAYRFWSYIFLGDRGFGLRRLGSRPVFRIDESLQVDVVEPHPKIVTCRHELGIDYGKLDFVIIDGEPLLLDANKTIGDPGAATQSRLPDLAMGLYAFV